MFTSYAISIVIFRAAKTLVAQSATNLSQLLATTLKTTLRITEQIPQKYFQNLPSRHLINNLTS